MFLYIELWKVKPTWQALLPAAREQFMQAVGAGKQELATQGIEVYSWGNNDAASDQVAPYDYFGIWKMPNTAAITVFEGLVKASGWYDYFEQVN